MLAEQSNLNWIQTSKRKRIHTSLDCVRVIGHRTVGREKEDRNNNWRAKWWTLREAKYETVEDRHLWHLGIDGRLLTLEILIIINLYLLYGTTALEGPWTPANEGFLIWLNFTYTYFLLETELSVMSIASCAN